MTVNGAPAVSAFRTISAGATALAVTGTANAGIALFIFGLAFFVVGEALVKLLHDSYGTTQIVWSRYFFHFALTCLFLSRGNILAQARSARPWLHASRSILMLVATAFFLLP